MNELPEQNKIALAGDWHKNTHWGVQAVKAAAAAGAQYLIHVGDFGLYDDPLGNRLRSRLQKACNETGLEIIVVPGNNEDYKLLNSIRKVNDLSDPMNGWLRQKKYPSITYAPRGARLKIRNLTFLLVGGANSINRWRKSSWFKEEQITAADIVAAQNGGKADIMVSHDTAWGVPIVSAESDRKARSSWG